MIAIGNIEKHHDGSSAYVDYYAIQDDKYVVFVST